MNQVGDDNRPASTTRVVVLGASGMLGSELVRSLSRRPELSVRGTVRDIEALPAAFREECEGLLTPGVDVTNPASRSLVLRDADVVVNAIGVIKQAAQLDDRVSTVELNALLPQQLARECAALGSRLIHVSTDCVFSGRRGNYGEDDVPDPVDFYGRSKLLGEVPAPALTLRTSIVGHEVHRHASLIDWFLSQPQGHVRGFTGAIYSGVTTTELARMLADVVLPRQDLQGLWHVASRPIRKFDLLRLVAAQYGWAGEVDPFDDFTCDRSMVADRLAQETGYRPPSWVEMIHDMFVNRPPWAVMPGNKESSS